MKGLALVDAPDHVCCRYRLRAFQPALATSGGSLTIEALDAGPVARLRQFGRAGEFDVVILQRKLLPGWQLRVLRRYARRLVFDFDDAVLYRDSYDPRGPHSPRRAARFARTVRLVDAVLAGNEFLAQTARAHGCPPENVRILPTCIDPTWYDVPRPARLEPSVDLVWIGSSSTLQGLERQRPLWERIGRELSPIRLRMISDRFTDFGPLAVQPVPWNELTEPRDLGTADVGISWIPDDLWSRGKCGLKVLQYQAAGLPVVANPVGVHPAMIGHGSNGFLAESQEQWIDSLRTLVADPALRERLGRQGRADVVGRYSVPAWTPVFLAAVTGVGPRSRAA